MLYQPTNERMWDSWLVRDDAGGRWLLFYIRITDGHKGLWHGVSVAESSDLLHWKYLGPVLEKSPEAVWLGTGMIVRHDNQYVMNFSEETPDRRQTIHFATSRDLVNWQRLPQAFTPDPRWYGVAPETLGERIARFDSLGIVEVPGRPTGRYLGFFTATAANTLPGASGVLGLAESDDLVNWRCLPPASAPGFFPAWEVPEHVEFNGRHYMLACTHTPLGNRFDPVYPGQSGGTYYFVADELEGPYVYPPTDPLLQGVRCDIPVKVFNNTLLATAVGRPFRLADGTTLYYHQWGSLNRSPNALWGPPKKLVERGPWELGLDYWEGCEKLKGTLLADGPTTQTLQPGPHAGALPLVNWTVQGDQVRADHAGGSDLATWSAPAPADVAATPLADGRILETALRIDSGKALGLWIGCGEERIVLLLNAQRREIELCRALRTYAPSVFGLLRWHSRAWPVATGVSHQVRLMFRGECLELYIDDRCATSAVAPAALNPAQFGFACELACGSFTHSKVWRMH